MHEVLRDSRPVTIASLLARLAASEDAQESDAIMAELAKQRKRKYVYNQKYERTACGNTKENETKVKAAKAAKLAKVRARKRKPANAGNTANTGNKPAKVRTVTSI